MDKLSIGMKGISPALLGVGAALQGDMGATTRSMLKEQQALSEQTQTQNLTGKGIAGERGRPDNGCCCGTSTRSVESIGR